MLRTPRVGQRVFLVLRVQTRNGSSSSLTFKKPLSSVAGLQDSEQPQPSSSSSRQAPTYKTVYPPQSIQLRTWTFIESPMDALAIIRAVERIYGRVAEYKFARDFENPTAYQVIVNVSFRDQESFQRVPPDGQVIQVPLPPRQAPGQAGGISLEDIENYALPIERGALTSSVSVPGFTTLVNHVIEEEKEGNASNVKNDGQTAPRIMGCAVKRLSQYYSSPPLSSRHNTHSSIGRNFLKWGGFYKFPPMERGRVIKDEELFSAPSSSSSSSNNKIGRSSVVGQAKDGLEHIKMRAALRMWAAQTGYRNPYEFSPGRQDSTQPSRITDQDAMVVGEEEGVSIQLNPDDLAWEDLPKPVLEEENVYEDLIIPDAITIPESTVTAASPSAKVSTEAKPPTIGVVTTSPHQSTGSMLTQNSPPPTTASSNSSQDLTTQLKAAKKLAQNLQKEQDRKRKTKAAQNRPPVVQKQASKPTEHLFEDFEPSSSQTQKEQTSALQKLKGIFGGWS